MKIQFCKFLLSMSAPVFLLTGCLYGQCINGPCALEHTKILDAIKPYGAHWIKDGMTRESRREDFLECGGSANLQDGFEDWLSSVPYEIYSAKKTRHIRLISDCMRAKTYLWIEKCDERCMYP